MGTPAQIAANQANSKLSTGPASAEGKARSSRNSFKHGLYSKQLVLPHEDPAELDRLRASLRAEHSPINTTEDILVNELAENFWRLRRMREREAAAMQPGSFGTSVELGLLAIIQRTLASAERGLHRSLIALRRLQKDRGFVPQASASADEEIGFVPQESSQPIIVPDEPAVLSVASKNSAVPEEFLPFLDEDGCLKPGNSAALHEHLKKAALASLERYRKTT
ncbi:MAG: hypothetical protein JO340_19765 [Acidobacteriaceae bacterium]|nr:hypothetical protein [Acidobacteriaceae bacterium]